MDGDVVLRVNADEQRAIWRAVNRLDPRDLTLVSILLYELGIEISALPDARGKYTVEAVDRETFERRRFAEWEWQDARS